VKVRPDPPRPVSLAPRPRPRPEAEPEAMEVAGSDPACPPDVPASGVARAEDFSSIFSISLTATLQHSYADTETLVQVGNVRSRNNSTGEECKICWYSGTGEECKIFWYYVTDEEYAIYSTVEERYAGTMG
jgi:hypothetical protein